MSKFLNLFLPAKNPTSIRCPVAGKFRFIQRGDILFETRIRGGVTSSPRPNVKCQEIISDFSVCDADQKIIYVDAEYCISVDYFGSPVDIYSNILKFLLIFDNMIKITYYPVFTCLMLIFSSLLISFFILFLYWCS